MEYIWQDKLYHQKFIELSEIYKDDYSEFSNLMINDMNELLFDGLLALEVIRDFEVLKADAEEWARLDEEEKKQKEEHYT